MNRRRFLGVLGAAPLAFSSRFALAKKAVQKTNVVVVGAGLAGLNAALHLLENNVQVTLLEARERIGGRAWTSRVWSDLPVDLGGSWIHGQDKNPLVPLAKKAGASPVLFDYDSVQRYWAEGKELSQTEDTQLDRLIERLHTTLEQHEDQPALKVAEVIKKLERNLSSNQQRMLAYAVSSEIEHNWGSPPNELSIAGYLEGDGFEGGDLLLPGQVGLLPEFLAKQIRQLGGVIRLGSAVNALQFTNSGVAVKVGNTTIQADHVVLTAPLGVLQAGSIGLPTLPHKWQQALQELRMGSLEKLVLRFPEVFWENTNYTVQLPQLVQAGRWVDTLNLHNFTKIPALMLFNGGVEGRKTNDLDDTRLVKSAMTMLRGIFPDAPNPIAAQRSRWGRDPFALGSYSFATGANPANARNALQEPLAGKIWLAGEHTSIRAPQSFHGAYLEGERVAKAILKK
ncbi:MAG: flavin monoamine oxidase family protein [Deinococcales bacterium]